MAKWFTQIMGTEVGPFSDDQLKQKAMDGKIDPATPVRRDGSSTWYSAGDVKGLFVDKPLPLKTTASSQPAMPTKACLYCKSQIPITASKCPVCNEWQSKPLAAQSSKTNKWAIPLAVLVAGFAICCGVTSFVLNGVSKVAKVAEAEANRPRSPEEIRKKKIADQFDIRDGSHKLLVEYVKGRMNDPESFQHVETKCKDNGNSIDVLMKYRGKNAFGGVLTKNIAVQFDLDGHSTKFIGED